MKKRIICAFLVISCLSGCGAPEEDVHTTNGGKETSVQETYIRDEDVDSGEEIKYVPSEELLSDIRSFQIQIGDNLYRFPLSYADFSETGWKINERYASVDGQLASGNHKLVWFIKDDIQVNCYMYNPDVSVQKYSECVVAGVNVDVRFESKGETIYIPGGLRLGVATFDDVIAVIGEPDDVYSSASITRIKYNTESIWSNVELTFDQEGILVAYNSENPVIPDDFEITNPQDLNIEYVAPTEMGTSIESRTVCFSGDLYTLPAPLSALLDNGWSVTESDATVSGNGTLRITLYRDDVSFSVQVWNYSQTACTPKDAYVEKLSSTYTYGEEFLVTDRIGMTITETELMDILNGEGYDYSQEQTSNGTCYTVKLNGVDWNDYCTIKFESGDVLYITISSSNHMTSD